MHIIVQEAQALSTTCQFLLTSGAPAPAPGQKLLSLGSQGGENNVPPKVPIMIEPPKQGLPDPVMVDGGSGEMKAGRRKESKSESRKSKVERKGKKRPPERKRNF